MTPHERLLQRKAELDYELDGFLLSLDEDEASFAQRIVPAHAAAAYYREALSEAADHVDLEKSEAYRETAEEAIKFVTQFIGVLGEHRKRQRQQGSRS